MSCIMRCRNAKVNVWIGLMRSNAYGPFIFTEETIIGNVCLDILEHCLEPQLRSGEIMDTVVFEQDGTPSPLACLFGTTSVMLSLANWSGFAKNVGSTVTKFDPPL